jgi:hypothetical protein
LTPVFLRVKTINLLIMACLISVCSSVLSYTCTIGANTGVASYACDPRCVQYSGNTAMHCCTSLTATTNYDCLYACSTDSTSTLVGKVYLWPAAIQPTRCDSYCPTHYFVYSSDPSGTSCRLCNPWCGDCTDTYCYTCTSCDSAAYQLNSSACYNIASQWYGSFNPCADGYYGLQIQMVCAACPTGCATCSIYLTWEMPGGSTPATYFSATYNQNNINCTGDPLCGYTLQCYSCNNGYTLLNGLCYSNSQCLTYSYYTAAGGTFNPSSCNCFPNYQTLGLSICAKCHIYCLTCSSSGSSGCLTCPPGSTNSSAAPASCSYNSTYSQIDNWVSAAPSISSTVTASGWYMTGAAPLSGVNQMSCTSGAYVFGYYGLNNKGNPYFNSGLPEGQNLFPSDAKLVYNRASVAAHYGIHIRATLLFIDQWTNGLSILVQENSNNAFEFTYQMEGIAGEYLCGLNYDDHLDVLDNWFPHNSASITNLIIKASTASYAWGIKELLLHVMVCDPSCSACSGPTSADCVSCPANQAVSSGVCVCNTASNYYNLSGTCTTNCGSLYRNPSTFSCVSTCSWPYAFGYNNSGTFECRISCPPSYYQNYSNSLCVSSCFQPGVSIASNYYMFDGSNRICSNTCPTGTFGDPQSGSCVATCPAYNSSTNDGYFSSGGYCYEICPLATLFAYLPQRACLSSCPLGYFKNYASKNGSTASICEQECSITLNGTYLYGDNATGFCTNYCSAGTYGDISTNLCLSVCNSSAFAQSITVSGTTSRLCVVNCSVNDSLYGNPLTGFCVTAANCPTNYYADPLTSLCTRTCSGALYYGDNATHMCITTTCSNISASLAFKNNQTKICVKTCLNNNSLLAP